MEASENKYHYIVALLLGLAGLLIIFIFVTLRSQADQLTQTGNVTTTISNSNPTINSITLTGAQYSGGTFTSNLGPTDLSTDTTDNLTVAVAYTDLNSCNQVAARGSFFVRFGTGACEAGGTNYNSCYEEDSNAGTFTCTDDCTGESDTQATITCVYPVRHFADPATWLVSTSVTDEDSGNSVATTTFVKATVSAISLVSGDSDMNFGTMNLGASTATGSDQTVRVRDTGNTAMVLSTYGANFQCTKQINTFPVTNLKFTTTSGKGYSTMGATLATTSANIGTTLSEQDITLNIVENAEYESTYWGLAIPSTGVAGSCTTTVTIAGAAS